MVDNILVHTRESAPLLQFLESRDFDVEQVTESVISVTRPGELPVFVHVQGQSLYFEVDLAGMNDLSSGDICYALLDLNSEILPVSVGIDSTDAENHRLVLLESREADNLDENELMSVLDALELATEKVEKVLEKYV